MWEFFHILAQSPRLPWLRPGWFGRRKSMQDDSTTIQRALTSALRRALRPLARLFLRHGLPFKSFAEVAKEVFVEAADQDFRLDGKRSTDARISVLTGLTRKDVRRLRSADFDDQSAQTATTQFNRAARVTTAWAREARYCNKAGEPLALPFDGPGPSFVELVRGFSGDMPARAVLDELLRLGAVLADENDHYLLSERGYVPRDDEIAKLGILGEDVHTLAATIEHNLDPGSQPLWFQRKVRYDNVSAASLANIRSSAGKRGQDLLEILDGEISEHDHDLHPELEDSDRKQVVVGVYYWEGDLPDSDEESS